MTDHSPQFRDPHKNCNSPVPLRSPSPDFVTRSAILSTPPTSVQYRNTTRDKTSLMQQVKFLREQNMKLKAAVSNRKDNFDGSSLNEIILKKQKLIENLQNQLKAVIGGTGKDLVVNQLSNNQIEILKLQNEQLKSKIELLSIQNQNLKKGKSFDSIKIPDLKQIQLTKSNIQKIKQAVSGEFNSSINQMMNSFSLKLQDIQRRVQSIQGKMANQVRDYSSGQKGNISTIGPNSVNVSPGPISNNTVDKDNFTTPSNTDKKYFSLIKKIGELENELFHTKTNQRNLKMRQNQYEDQLIRKNNEIRKIQEQSNKLSSSKKRNYTSLTDSQHRNSILEQNHPTISKLNSQIFNLKEQNLLLETKISSLKNDLDNQRKLKIQSISVGANQTDQHIIQKLNIKIQQLQNKNKELVHESIALKDTLKQLRRTHNQTANDLNESRKLNQSSHYKIQQLNRQNSDLKVRVRQDSNADIQASTENMKLRLRINELERQSRQLQFNANQYQSTRKQLNDAQNLIRQLKSKQFDLQNQANNYKRQAQRAFSLAQQNEMLKKTIGGYQRSQQDLLKGSDHTKNQLMKTIQQKTALQNQVIQLKSNLRIMEVEIVSARQKILNIQKQYKKLQQINDTQKMRTKQIENNLHNIISEKDNLIHQNNSIKKEFQNLDTEYRKLKADNQKQQLINQNNNLKTKLRESEHHLTNSKRLEEQKNNELQSALFELSQIKRLLLQMKFDTIQDIIRELQNKQRLAYEQRQQYNRLSQINSQQLSKLSLENDKLKKQMLEMNQKIIIQRQKADKLMLSIRQLQGQKQILNDKILRLDETIQQFISQDNTRQILSKFQQKDITLSSNFYDQRLNERQLQEIDYLKQPLNRAVEKIDKVSEKVTRHIADYHNRRDPQGIAQTQSFVIPSFDIKNSSQN